MCVTLVAFVCCVFVREVKPTQKPMPAFTLSICTILFTEIPKTILDTLAMNIPFLGPPNQMWPEDIIRGVKDFTFGDLQRTKNETEIDALVSVYSESDLKLTPVLSVEVKDWGKPIDLATFKGIVNKALSKKCRLHIVLCNSLQDKYDQMLVNFEWQPRAPTSASKRQSKLRLIFFFFL